MTLPDATLLRLRFLLRVVRKECRQLIVADRRLFEQEFSVEQAARLETDIDLAERADAFVSRFGRLQDTLGDKLPPLLLDSLGEKAPAAIDKLGRAERLGLLRSADEWMTIRNLRNQMIHEYIEDLTVLAGALRAGHDFVPVLIEVADGMIAEIERRGWI